MVSKTSAYYRLATILTDKVFNFSLKILGHLNFSAMCG